MAGSSLSFGHGDLGESQISMLDLKVLTWHSPIDDSGRRTKVGRVRLILDARGLGPDDGEVKSLSIQEADL